MKIILYGHTAYEWWSRAKGKGQMVHAVRGATLFDCSPSVAGVEYLRRVAPFLSEPYHMLVFSQKARRNLLHTVVHSSVCSYPDGSFYRVENGLYASSPELCFVQECADGNDVLELIKDGYSLCGAFALNSLSSMGVEGRRPLTSRLAIARYCENVSGLQGVSKARKLARHLLDGAASPRESDLAMRLTLPYRLGGFNLQGACLNYRIELGRRGRQLARRGYHVADMCWPSANLVVEYDSDAAHLNPSQMTFDAIRRNALEADGFKVITVTSRQLDSPDEMAKIACQIARCVGSRIRPSVAGYETLQSRLCGLC